MPYGSDFYATAIVDFGVPDLSVSADGRMVTIEVGHVRVVMKRQDFANFAKTAVAFADGFMKVAAVP